MQLSLGNLWSGAEADWSSYLQEDEAGLLEPAEKELCGQMEGTEQGPEACIASHQAVGTEPA